MKKVISLLLALAIVMSLSVTAFAAEGDATDVGAGEYSTNVTGSYVAGTEASGTVFSVDISWTAMSFTYHAEKAPVWDAENHEYSESTPAYWEGEGKITVTNHSNTKITAKPEYTPGENYGNADMVFSSDLLRVASAENGSAQIGTITVTPDPNGYLPKMDAAATIGSITVTIAQDNDVTVEEAETLFTNADNLKDTWVSMGGSYDDTDYSKMATCNAELGAVINAFKEETATQEDLNSIYGQTLDAYNTLNAKLSAL